MCFLCEKFVKLMLSLKTDRDAQARSAREVP